MLWPILFALTVLVSLYDLRTHHIPNWVTLPLWAAGFIVHFPSTNEILLASAILVIAFTGKWMGAGDVKLWLVLIWAMPPSVSDKVLPVMFGTFFVTGFIQLVWRRWWHKRQRPVTGLASPAAWRTIPFVVAVWLVH
jgi:Flp pilus assembly protein protease CpaA